MTDDIAGRAETVGPSTTGNHRHGRLMSAATILAVSNALFLIIVKFIALLMTGSVALLGSLIDSMMDFAASAMNFIAVRHALEPPDEEHRFGHGKAEALAGLGQFAFMGGSAAFLGLESGDRLLNPEPLEATMIGYVVMVIAIVTTLALVTFQGYVVRRTGSLAIGADEIHYRSDLLMNLGVMAAIALSTIGGFGGADALFGLGIAIWLGYSATRIFQRSWDELMDREFDEADRERISQIVRSFPEVRDMHDLRTRRSGVNSFIQFHLELDGSMKLVDAHRIADRVEAAVMTAFDGAEVIIHQDPAGVEDIAPLEQA